MGDGERFPRSAMQIDLDCFFVSEEFGFILEQPATDLPDYYRVWMGLASNLTPLIQTHQLRDLVNEMPVLSPHHLKGHRELRLAHLALGFITMGYVWQEGQNLPAQTLPKSLALPYWLVSKRLGLPPILTYADSVLVNWRLKDPIGDMEIGNLETLFSFPGGESCKGFFLVSLLVERAASSGIQGAFSVMNAVVTCDIISIQKGLYKVGQSLRKMKEIFELMHRYVDPTAFHGTLRIFFSGWRDNPMLPGGLLYEGVVEEPMMLSGGSAAQSSSIQCFDVLLGICHDDHAASFLKRMREYMLPSHRQLIETLSGCPPLRDFILSCSSPSLCINYDSCVSALVNLRSYHLSAVTRYITVPGHRARTMRCPLNGVGSALDETGTGGSSPLPFLKSIRDATQRALISQTRLTSQSQC
ncbi:indoleamine 2,3-dioxygenase 2 [Salmo salar]|uniref:Indoleamine 2,3-dioxygenase 2 n=1 Tax=Salmo salar TaxID=8030 RepID=A0A1S3N462_SALSA|nr:indoleamine 2,3-dioxygenase 2 [Salmo salar]|eukprot:XP_014010172.1 PREDICTED: indoleamine 2,3-dioxygenase 2-like [Salmo salar]